MTGNGKPARPGRAVIFLGEDTLERLLDLPPHQHITGLTTDFPRLGILLAVESHQFPPRTPGTAPRELPVSADVLDTDAKIARLLGELADARCERDRLREEVGGLRRQLGEACGTGEPADGEDTMTSPITYAAFTTHAADPVTAEDRQRGYAITHRWDGETFPDRDAAVEHGYDLSIKEGYGNFALAVMSAGTLLAVVAMDGKTTVTLSPELDAIAGQVGIAAADPDGGIVACDGHLWVRGS